LEENGKASSSKQTRNMEIRYIFVKEKIASKLVEIHHCPTESMIAYFYLSPCSSDNSRNTRTLSSMIGTSMRVDPV